MKLSDKISVIFFMEMLSLIIIIFIFSNTIFLSGFEDIEMMNVKKNLARLNDELEYEVNLLDSINLDYSSWDDTYDFLTYGDEDYIGSNLENVTISENFRIDFVVITDKEGVPVFKTEYNLNTGREEPIENGVAEAIAPEELVSGVIQNGTFERGIVKTPDEFAIMSIRPVLMSNGRGVPAGAMIMGRRLSEREISRFSRLTYLDLNMYQYDQFKSLEGIKDINGALVKTEGDTIKSYLPVKTVGKEDTVVFEISNTAELYPLGVYLIRKYIYVVMAMAFIFAYVSNRVFEKAVTARIMKLQGFMENMGKGGAKKKRVKIAGKDEISSLGTSINLMLDRLEKSHEKAFQEEQRYRLLFEHMSESFAYVKAVYGGDDKIDILDFIIIEANSQFYKMMGLEGLGLEYRSFGDIEKSYGYPIGAVTKGFNEFWNEKVSGNTQEIQIKMDASWYSVVIYALQAEHFGMIFWDITAIKERESDIMEMAKLDHLTNLPNRKYLAEYIEDLSEDALKNKKMFAVMFLDVDDFKSINDTYGHKYGDYVLKTIAQIISETVRKDDFVARIGGDEFVVVMSGIRSERDPLGFSNRIQKQIYEYFSEKEISKMGISIGISIFPKNGLSIEELIENADKAMYNVKKSGKGKSELYVEEK